MTSFLSDISAVTSQYLCNSCGACFAACNQGAIRYIETMGGYVFPQIDLDSCIHCGLCYEVCPGLHFGKTLTSQMPQDPFVGNILSCEIGRATDEAIFSNSQSGGVATAFLKHLFESGKIEAAIVAVIRQGTPPRGDVLLARSPAEVIQAQKSKYTPIPLLKAMREIKQYHGGVALVGLPCHIHGLNNLLDISPQFFQGQMYKIGLVCDRVMTTAGIDYMGSKATPEKIKNIVWRDKLRPTYPGNPVIYTVSGEEILLDASLRIAIKDFFTPVRCRLCFDKLNIFADVVLGDPHGVNDVDRVHGETLVLVRTEKGTNLIDSAKASGATVLRKASVQAAVKGQGVDKKRENWAGYMKAWKDLGRPLPQYPFTDQSFNAKKNHFEKWLIHGLMLDAFQTKAEMSRSANNWVLTKKMRKKIHFVLSSIKRIAKCLK